MKAPVKAIVLRLVQVAQAPVKVVLPAQALAQIVV